MTESLPTKLKKEPLIDAIFEARFATVPNILPGLLYTTLKGVKTLEQLPLSQIPQAIRDRDLNMHYAPLCRLVFDDFYINIGDRTISISCRYPYPGWDKFQPEIMTVFKALKKSDLEIKIERYSLKYIDILPLNTFPQQVSALNLKLNLADYSLESEHHEFDIKLTVNENGFTHLIQLSSSVTATLPDKNKKEGVAIDVDSIAIQSSCVEFKEFIKTLPVNLEKLHLENKRIFFSCLKTGTIKSLEPVYE